MDNGRARILIVEDEWLLADLLEELVSEFGYDVAGPVASVAAAGALIATGGIGGAILDVSLGERERSYPVASQLMERDIPFLFVTGYLETDLPAEFRHIALLRKPVAGDVLKFQLEQILTSRR
jgi:DNA-binding response OmpR family regulator